MIYTNEDIKKKTEKRKKREKIIRIISIPLMIIIISLTIYIIYQKYVKKAAGIDIFGYKIYTVLTGSMEPQYNVGDLIIEKPIEQNNIKEGTVITYAINEHKTVTHRVVDIVKKDGKILYRTKGDNNNKADVDLVEYSQVKGSILFKVGKVGKIISEFASGIGIVVILILIWISYIHSSRTEEKRIAREDARKRFNMPKYKKEKIL